MSAAVVYVDDEPAICRIVKWRLERAGLPVETFTDGEAALAWIGRNPVRCVLCDQRMPSMSGLDLRDRLEGDVPFWIVTGDISVGEELAARSGIRGMLAKPIDFDALVAMIQALP